MASKSPFRLEWISFIYLALFVLAVMSPSLVTRSFFGVDEVHIEEGLIFLFGVVGMAIFALYQRLMERTEEEHQEAKTEYERARRELVESYRYIGSINRQIEFLKKLANQTSVTIVESDRLTKDLLQSLVSNAAASVNAKGALIRYVHLEKLRTEREVAHNLEGDATFKVHNRDLKKLHESGAAHAYLQSEDGHEILVVPSDHQGKAVKAYLLIATDPDQAPNIDTTLLKVFANQAELLHFSLEEQPKVTGTAMHFIEDAQRSVRGEVS